MTNVGAAAIVDAINRRHGTMLTVREAASAGESKPWIVTDGSGARYLLKWSDGAEFRIEQAREIVERLRRRGYPVRAYLVAGRAGKVAYAVRPMVRGRALAAPMEPLDAAYLPRLLQLNELQAGAAAGLASNWGARMLDSVRLGFDEWCVHQTLRDYSAETAAIVLQLEQLGRDLADTPLRTTDAVHGDFTGANVLVEKDELAAVIDWEGADAGDRAFDLATLLFYDYLNPPVRDALLFRLLEIASPAAIRLCLAHLIIRQLDWSLRHHQRPAVEHFLGITRRIMRERIAGAQ